MLIRTLFTLGSFQHIERKIIAAAGYQYQQVRLRNKKQTKIRDITDTVSKEKSEWVRKDHKKDELKERLYPDNCPIWNSRVPTDNVWIHSQFPKPSYSFQEVIKMHKEVLDPTMLNVMDARLYADWEINLKTKKKTKFSSVIKTAVKLPHEFDHGADFRIAIFCESEEDKKLALDLGAVFAGGTELIERIESKEIDNTEFDLVGCTPELLNDLVKIRGAIGKDLLPTAMKGTLNADVKEMMNNLKSSILIDSKKITPSIAAFQIPFAKLDMPEEHIFENLKALYDFVALNRSTSSASLGNYILKIIVTAPPSGERLKLKLDYEEFDEVKVRKSKPKSEKKAKKAKEKVEEVEEDKKSAEDETEDETEEDQEQQQVTGNQSS